MFRRGLLVIAVTLAAVAPFVSQARADNVSDFMAKWDPDHDGTLDLAEINKAASATFDKLDADHDGTLDQKELGNRVTDTEFKAADKDNDGTLDKAEYEAIVAKHFQAANRDSDKTIDATELRTAAGSQLLQLLS